MPRSRYSDKKRQHHEGNRGRGGDRGQQGHRDRTDRPDIAEAGAAEHYNARSRGGGGGQNRGRGGDRQQRKDGTARFTSQYQSDDEGGWLNIQNEPFDHIGDAVRSMRDMDDRTCRVITNMGFVCHVKFPREPRPQEQEQEANVRAT